MTSRDREGAVSRGARPTHALSSVTGNRLLTCAARSEWDGIDVLASYVYLGQGTAVRIDYEQPEVRLDLWGPGETSGTYAGFDRFGRVIDQRWRDYSTPADVVRHEHGYDRASNRLYRKDVVAGSGHDELYSYDGLHRLTGAQRGTLNAQRDAVSGGTLNFAQAWALNQLGNWDGFQQDDNGDATWNLEQTRAHNLANEITAIGATTGTVWADPAHDRAGNMTTIPQPAALADSFTAVYDAWNRLVRVTNDADNDKTVAEYAYDARNFRIVKKVYDDGSLDETRYAFFSESWQVLEERVDGTASTDVEVQYVWGMRYIDELICRDRDTTANGIPNERTYALQDANFNVVAIVAASGGGTVLERYRFTAYGQRTVLNANFTVHADPTAGGYAFVIGHQGLTHDLETGFIDNRHRFIIPPLGRFGQRDPLGYVDGMGLYVYYAGMHGVVDPSGLAAGTEMLPLAQAADRALAQIGFRTVGANILVKGGAASASTGVAVAAGTASVVVVAAIAGTVAIDWAYHGEPIWAVFGQVHHAQHGVTVAEAKLEITRKIWDQHRAVAEETTQRFHSQVEAECGPTQMPLFRYMTAPQALTSLEAGWPVNSYVTPNLYMFAESVHEELAIPYIGSKGEDNRKRFVSAACLCPGVDTTVLEPVPPWAELGFFSPSGLQAKTKRHIVATELRGPLPLIDDDWVRLLAKKARQDIDDMMN